MTYNTKHFELSVRCEQSQIDGKLWPRSPPYNSCLWLPWEAEGESPLAWGQPQKHSAIAHQQPDLYDELRWQHNVSACRVLSFSGREKKQIDKNDNNFMNRYTWTHNRSCFQHFKYLRCQLILTWRQRYTHRFYMNYVQINNSGCYSTSVRLVLKLWYNITIC